MKLRALMAGMPGLRRLGDADPDPEVTHLTLDSRAARPGSLFLAVQGKNADGGRFAADAAARGAVAAVFEAAPAGPPPIPGFVAEDVRDLVGRLAARLHADLIARMRLFGVTGTKGKTTTTRMLARILDAGGVPAGSIGTLGWIDRTGRIEPVANTTPDAARIVEILGLLDAAGHRAVALEASSQAAVQARVRHLPLEGLAFTNLSPEHGELHATFEEYGDAKARLFADAAALRPDLAVVVPAADPHAEKMVKAAGPRARVIRFAAASAAPAEVRGELIECGLGFLEMALHAGGESGRVRLRFGGHFNLMNALAAVGLAHAAGIRMGAIEEGLGSLEPVPGRFQVVEHGGVHAMVDYAHSANALEELLKSCRRIVDEGRILLVFGCGGEKDPTKRPKMGAASERFADLVWVTNDNPRREDPAKIAEAILAGISPEGRARTRVELDRAAAIRAALGEARPGDLVVVAGKGHEPYQILGTTTIEFDDLVEIRRAWGLA